MDGEQAKTFFAHLGELRRRIIWVLLVFVVALVMGLLSADPLLNYLKNSEPANGIEWNVFSPWDAITIYMQIAFVVSLIVVVPFALLQFWFFVKPGLKAPEQRATLKYIPMSLVFLLAGLAFAYFVVFPLAFHFTESVTRYLDLTQTYGITAYFSFMFNILVPVSLLFEMPVLVMFLTKLRILTPERLRAARKISYLILVIVATLVTPPDFISDILVAVPLIVLYELSVWLSSITRRKQIAGDSMQTVES